MRLSAPFGYYHFDGFKVDVFGYNTEKARYVYSVETPYNSKVREAKPYYARGVTSPVCYIIIIDPRGNRQRLYLD